MTLSTHVLDTATGKPAEHVPVTVERAGVAGWQQVASGTTGPDGRLGDLVTPREWGAGTWRVTFDTSARSGFYPRVRIEISVPDDRHCHVPLLLSPYGYTTYRGS